MEASVPRHGVTQNNQQMRLPPVGSEEKTRLQRFSEVWQEFRQKMREWMPGEETELALDIMGPDQDAFDMVQLMCSKATQDQVDLLDAFTVPVTLEDFHAGLPILSVLGADPEESWEAWSALNRPQQTYVRWACSFFYHACMDP